MRRLIVLFFGSALITFASLSWYLWRTNLPLISPLDVIATLAPKAHFVPQTQKTVFGFLPYWNMKYSDQIPIRYLTHLAYFGVDLTSQGTIREFDNPGEREPGLNKLNSPEFSQLHRQLKLVGKKSILLVRAFDPEQIETIVNQPRYAQIAITSIMDLVKAKQFDGINVDFEYVGNPESRTKANFTKFVADLADACRRQLPGCEISVDVFADSAIKDRLWDLKGLSASADHIVIMAYDYYRPSSAQAGPVAPLRGACGGSFGSIAGVTSDGPPCLDYDVTQSIVDTLKQVPPEKVIMGVPFYGYEWQTAGDAFLANTYDDSGATASYRRIQELLSAPDQVSSISAKWNDSTMSPYLVYKDGGATYQIHYEDPRSLGLKLDLVNQSVLGGIAIWALGYETPYQELWQTIAAKLYN